MRVSLCDSLQGRRHNAARHIGVKRRRTLPAVADGHRGGLPWVRDWLRANWRPRPHTPPHPPVGRSRAARRRSPGRRRFAGGEAYPGRRQAPCHNLKRWVRGSGDTVRPRGGRTPHGKGSTARQRVGVPRDGPPPRRAFRRAPRLLGRQPAPDLRARRPAIPGLPPATRSPSGCPTLELSGRREAPFRSNVLLGF
jgi:hypothetical protein